MKTLTRVNKRGENLSPINLGSIGNTKIIQLNNWLYFVPADVNPTLKDLLNSPAISAKVKRQFVSLIKKIVERQKELGKPVFPIETKPCHTKAKPKKRFSMPIKTKSDKTR